MQKAQPKYSAHSHQILPADRKEVRNDRNYHPSIIWAEAFALWEHAEGGRSLFLYSESFADQLFKGSPCLLPNCFAACCWVY